MESGLCDAEFQECAWHLHITYRFISMQWVGEDLMQYIWSVYSVQNKKNKE